MKCSNCKQFNHNARTCRYMTKEMFVEEYYASDVPEWLAQFKDDLDKVIETAIEEVLKESMW